jgi:hypothetical protein
MVFFNNCLNDDECSSNVGEGTTATITNTTETTCPTEECGCTENFNRLKIKISDLKNLDMKIEKIINILIAMNPKLKI